MSHESSDRFDMRQVDLDLITRVLAGSATPDERRELERWRAASPERAELVDAFRAAARKPELTTPTDRIEALLASAKRARVAEPTDESAKPPLQVVRAERRRPMFSPLGRRRMHPALKAAAIGALVVGVTIAGWLATQSGMSTTGSVASTMGDTVIAAARGQRIALRLPDGTLAVLAPSTTLRLAEGYGGRERTVEVEGEAAFTVVHDTTRPFTVHAAGMIIRDLGTRFVVRGYPDDPVADVVVAEGLVVVRRSSPDSLLLEPGDRARLTPDGQLALTRGVPLDRYFSWTEGRLVFQETPLRDVATRLERWYDVEIRLVPASLGNQRITASAADEPAGDVLQLLAMTLGLELTAADRVYTLTHP